MKASVTRRPDDPIAVLVPVASAARFRSDHVDLEAGTLAVWRSDRSGGDTKAPSPGGPCASRSRGRRSGNARPLSRRAAAAVRGVGRPRPGVQTAIGTILDQHNISREFRRVTEAAGLGGDWVPRELRHTFVSIMPENGVPVEEIARLRGHDRTTTTEVASGANSGRSSRRAPR
jgi:Phage integrase family